MVRGIANARAGGHDHPVPERERGSRGSEAGHVADPGRHHRLRLPDNSHRIRSARDTRLLPHATLHRQSLGRDVFAFALAVQNLLWGVGQPFAA
jgi:hypothetical protein